MTTQLERRPDAPSDRGARGRREGQMSIQKLHEAQTLEVSKHGRSCSSSVTNRD